MQKLSRNAAKKIKRSRSAARDRGEIVTLPGCATVRTATQSECKRAIKRLAYASDKDFRMFRGRVSVPDKVRCKAESRITADGIEHGIITQSPSNCTCHAGRCSYHEFALIRNRKGTLKLVRRALDSGAHHYEYTTPHKVGDRSGVTYFGADGMVIRLGNGSMDSAYLMDAELQTRINKDHDRMTAKAIDESIAASASNSITVISPTGQEVKPILD